MSKEYFVTSVLNFDITKLLGTKVQDYLNLSTLYRVLLNECIIGNKEAAEEAIITNFGLLDGTFCPKNT